MGLNKNGAFKFGPICTAISRHTFKILGNVKNKPFSGVPFTLILFYSDIQRMRTFLDYKLVHLYQIVTAALNQEKIRTGNPQGKT